MGRTDADGGVDIADRLTEWRSIATDALRAKGPSIKDVYIRWEERDYNVGPP